LHSPDDNEDQERAVRDVLKEVVCHAKEAFSSPTKDNLLCLRSFLDIKQQLDAMCVWPFGSYEVLHIVLIVIIPILVVLLEIVFA